MTRRLLLIPFILLNTCLFAQKNNSYKQLSYPQIDSILKVYSQVEISSEMLDLSRFVQQKAKEDFGVMDSVYLNYSLDLIHYLRLQRHYDEAEEIFSSCVNLVNELKGYNLEVHYLQMLREMVELYKDTGRKKEMFECHARLLVHSEKALGKTHPRHISEMNHGAQLYQDARQFDKAELILNNVLEIQRKTIGEQNIDYAFTLYSLSHIYGATHRPKEALSLQLQIKGIIEKTVGKDSQPYQAILSAIAGSYGDLKEYEKAEKMHLQSLNLKTSSHQSESVNYAVGLHNLALLYIGMNRFDDAHKRLEQSLAVYKLIRGEKHPNISTSYINFADLAHRQKQFKKGVDYIYKSLWTNATDMDSSALKEKTLQELVFDYNYANVYLVSTSLSMLDKVYASEYATTQDIKALKNRHKTLQLFAKYVEKMTTSFQTEGDKLWQVYIANDEYLKGIQVANKLHELDGNKNWLKEALFYLESNKAALLANAMKNNTAYQFGNIPDSLVAKEKALKQEASNLQKQLQEATALKKEDAIVKIRAEQLQNEKAIQQHTHLLESEFKAYYNYKYASSIVSLETTQEIIPDSKTAILEYYTWKNSLFVMAITKNDIQLVLLPLEAKKLEGIVSGLRKSLSNYKAIGKNRNQTDSKYLDLAYNSYQNFLAPILDSLKDIDHLIIVPDNLLGQIPFEAFLTKAVQDSNQAYKDLPYLLHDYKISYSYSIGLLTENNRQITSPTQTGILAFAASYATADNRSGERSARHRKIRRHMKELPAAHQELAALENQFGGQYYYADDASESRFKSMAQQYPIIHLAMHGMTSEHFPLLSSLAFTEIGDKEEDNFLEAHEISHLQLNAQLVVLSACETGFGKFEHGEGVLSLARSFMYAGVPSLVVSLWQVNDFSTAVLMQEFYQNLSQGKDKATALQEAKLAYLERAEGLMAHPAFWSPFIQLGDSRSINIHPKTPWLYWGLGGLALLLLAAVLFWFTSKVKAS